MLGAERVSWIVVMLNPVIFELESLDMRSTLKFYSQGTCYTSKDVKSEDGLLTLCIYFIS